ncbi:hypothetical protein LWI28_028113 [Acer negundo]|uniref:Uncharacterized protein n=1 Tax=Acer negundo TaxID=4023 RepID=A0AAD5NVX6_ACENE|nr:hypothetical protein LWI28_028113 [Acer negundo]
MQTRVVKAENVEEISREILDGLVEFGFEEKPAFGKENDDEEYYREEEAMQTRVVDAKNVEEISGEIEDGLVEFGFEEKPAFYESFLPL